MSNELKNETSPYLLQHKNNPVEWYPWNQAALNKAKTDDKPILISIGYSACHWCHVMAHESFENEEIAKLMNQYFVNIKIDREERPDLDHYFQQVLQLFGKQGGWPLTMFLTSKGKPFWGGTYFPPVAKFHLPSFKDVLTKIIEFYQTKKDQVEEMTQAVEEQFNHTINVKENENLQLNLNMCNELAHQLLAYVDNQHGGLKGAPKFPEILIHQFLWRAYERTQNLVYQKAVMQLLRGLSKGGIYDHLGGGYARYSTDEIWLVPHFEKMLYDNAQIIELLTLAWSNTHYPLFKQRVYETVAWLQKEMYLSSTGFASALDADSEGEEGKYYVWTEREIDEVLKGDTAYFKSIYGVTSPGNWDGKNILNLISITQFEDNEKLNIAREALCLVRQKRVYPGRDDKILSDWNGLMIHSLVQASIIFQQPSWLILAKNVFQFICEKMQNHQYRLSHSFCKSIPSNIGFLSDYAAMMRAAIMLYQVTAEQQYLVKAEQWLKVVNQFHRNTDDSYYYSALDEDGLLENIIETQDAAIPSSNGLILDVLVKLSFITGNKIYQAQVEKLFECFSVKIFSQPFGHSSILNAYDLYMRPLIITIFNPQKNELTNQFVSKIFQKLQTNMIVVHKETKEKPYAIVCRNFTCSHPIYDPEQLYSFVTTMTE